MNINGPAALLVVLCLCTGFGLLFLSYEPIPPESTKVRETVSADDHPTKLEGKVYVITLEGMPCVVFERQNQFLPRKWYGLGMSCDWDFYRPVTEPKYTY